MMAFFELLCIRTYAHVETIVQHPSHDVEDVSTDGAQIPRAFVRSAIQISRGSSAAALYSPVTDEQRA